MYACQSIYDEKTKSVINCTCGKCADALKSNSTQNDRVPDARKTIQNDWEKRFEDMNRNCDGSYGCGQFPPEIKRFVAKELADARREVIMEVERMINTKYPLNRFFESTKDSRVMTAVRGVQNETFVRRLNQSDSEHVEFLEQLLATLREEGV